MASKKWPGLPALREHPAVEAMYELRKYCDALKGHASQFPNGRLQASAVADLADAVITVLRAVSNDGIVHNRQVIRTAQDRIEARTSQFGNTSSSSPDSSPNLSASSWTSPSSGSSTPRKSTQPGPRDLTPPSTGMEALAGDGVGALKETQDHRNNERRVRVRWDHVAPPYRGVPNQAIRQEVQTAICVSIMTVQVGAVAVLPSGDLDIYTSSREDAETLVAHGDRWTFRLKQGQRTRTISDCWSILVHSVPRDWFTKQSLTNGVAKQQIMDQNPQVPGACVLYVGWAGDRKAPRASKPKSSLIVGFHRPEDANAILRAGVLYLNSTPLRTERYDPNGRLVQCVQCQSFGHVRRCCTSYTCCLYCAGPHDKTECPDRTNLRCANCQGPHTANDQECRTRKKALEQVNYIRKHKSKYHPETRGGPPPTQEVAPTRPPPIPPAREQPGPARGAP